MLILTGKPGETFALIDNATGEPIAGITVREANGKRASLAFSAPSNVRIIRHSLLTEEDRVKFQELNK